MQAREKKPSVHVWQYNDAAVINLPFWVSTVTEMHGDGLVLVRDTGKQYVEPGEWLVQEPSGDILWLTDAEFQEEYEITVG